MALISDKMEPENTIECPRCGDEEDDFDGFGFLCCSRCGYCTHSSVDGKTCSMCLKDVDGDEFE